jgi:hypothetical protein
MSLPAFDAFQGTIVVPLECAMSPGLALQAIIVPEDVWINIARTHFLVVATAP